MTNTLLKTYAELLINNGLNIKEGQKLRLIFPTDAIELAREIVIAAYKAGAVDVKTVLNDDVMADSRILYGNEQAISTFGSYDVEYAKMLVAEGYHNLVISSYSAPNEEIDVDKLTKYQLVRAKAMIEVSRLYSANAVKWCIAPYISKDWATLMYPELEIDKAEEKLLQDLMKITRVSDENPLESWNKHNSELKYRLKVLNEYKFDKVLFNDGETSLEVGLAKEAIWCGGNETYKDGDEFMPNIPTEEVFTMPHKDRINGHAKIRKPFVLHGKEITGLELDFVDGKVVKFKADNYEDLLKGMLDTDEGASRLGEVALVDKTSPINAFPKAFFNTLIDENAASHIALGNAYPDTTKASLDDKDEVGCNESAIHEDIMIGSENMTVIGVTSNGDEVYIMRNGSFTDEFRLNK